MAADSSDSTGADDRDDTSPAGDAPDTPAESSTDEPRTGSDADSATGTASTGSGSADADSAVADSDVKPDASAKRDADAQPEADTGAEAKPDADEDANTDEDAEDDEESTPYSPALIATAVALPIVLIVGVLAAAFIALRAPVEREPLALGPVPAPAADGPACQALLPALPADLGDYTKSTLVEPAPPATRAWQHPDGGEPIVLRCGLDRPLEFNRASTLTEINGVQWFQVRDEVGKVGTWFAVDRETYIALTVPDGSGTGAITTVSDVITANLPARQPNPGEL
ncbi:DUF3515 domain-containing protein [Nocardia rhizosphaerihabitans]|uniref:DUF3515 domain-containing protein n=1 Tax=Nocardia rhizosphaerihabitans TaxID=1691570 RepID=A0ABQ2K8D7_9NOCA|nr:DUF3515 domain-containing protein [Nocardia rhizosphaerihabitans]GGN71487.1 hypothetical protein GCM10011610_11760 [Nocardia rhizosphaerihabitans]